MITIIIPTRNRAALLGATLASVRDQTWDEWECLVVDDHSTDETEELSKDFVSKDPRFSYCRLEPTLAGANAARNAGLRMAKGELILFLDSDDMLASHSLQQRSWGMSRCRELDFAIWPTLLFDVAPGDSSCLWNVETGENDLDRFLRLDIPWQTAGAIWRRTALKKVGWWKEGLPSWQDWEIHLRALSLGLAYKRFEIPDNYWRKPRPDSLWNQSRKPDHLASQALLVDEVFVRLSENGLLNEKRKRLLAGLYFWLARVWFPGRRCRWQAIKIWYRAYKNRLVSGYQFIEGCRWFSHFTRGRSNSLAAVFPTWPKEYLIESSPTFLKVQKPA